MAYNSTIDKATDDILIYGNTAKDGSGTSYVPLLDADGHLQLDVLTSGLPSGASTSANQTTIIGHLDGVEGLLTTIDADTSGIATSVDGIEALLTTIDADTSGIATSVDGIEGILGTIDADTGSIMTAVQLLDNAVAVLGTATYTEATTSGFVVGAVRRDADTALVNTTNEVAPLIVDANGYLKVEIFDGGGSHTVDNNGTFVTQVDGAALTALQLLDDTIFADDAAFTPASSKVSAIGLLADSTSTDSVDEGDIGIPRMSLDRKQIVTNAPTAEGHGLAVFNGTSSDGGTALTSTAQVIKASAGQVYGWYIYNPNATAQFVQLYNTAAASVTVGTTNPLFMLTIPATSGANVEFTNGIIFSNAGFSCAATSTAGGNGAPTTALDVVIFYK